MNNTFSRSSAYSLMIRKWITTDPAFKDGFIIAVLRYRAKVEDPIVFSVMMVQESLCILATVAIEAFEANGGVAHDYDMIGHIHQVCESVSRELYSW